MPELPDVEGFKRVLARHALHKRIDRVVVSDARILGRISTRAFASRLRGATLPLLSSLADVPVRQSLAVTGSVNQLGEVQAIGAVNEKIEGFFDVCAARGLTGDQGVIIPASNTEHLMLKREVIEAAAAGRFAVYAVRDVDDAIELLTGMSVGAPDAAAGYPDNSINGRAARRLRELSRLKFRLLAEAGGRRLSQRTRTP